ncbi:hypothetical protein [Streptomyces sp. NPDC014733]
MIDTRTLKTAGAAEAGRRPFDVDVWANLATVLLETAIRTARVL